MVVTRALVTDTHPLLHYFFNKGKKLSRKAKQAFIDATDNKTQIIYVPAVVLWEISMLLEDGLIGLKMPFQDWVEALFKNYPTIISQPFDDSTVIHYYQKKLDQMPIGRFGNAEEIAIFVTELAMNNSMMCSGGLFELRGAVS